VHEIFGLTDWIRAVADALAEAGFIAVAPDLLTGVGPGGGGTEAFASRDDVTKAVSGLARPDVLARLGAVRAHALADPAADGRSAAIGFCWGGATTFAWAAAEPALDAAVVYYGTAPAEPDALGTVRAPVLGIYGSDDARVNATLEATRGHITRLGKWYEPHVFENAGHGFLRAQGGRDGANGAAAARAWPLTLAFLGERLRAR
jgi:carboxymethylenebutenolidase